MEAGHLSGINLNMPPFRTETGITGWTLTYVCKRKGVNLGDHPHPSRTANLRMVKLCIQTLPSLQPTALQQDMVSLINTEQSTTPIVEGGTTAGADQVQVQVQEPCLDMRLEWLRPEIRSGITVYNEYQVVTPLFDLVGIFLMIRTSVVLFFLYNQCLMISEYNMGPSSLRDLHRPGFVILICAAPR